MKLIRHNRWIFWLIMGCSWFCADSISDFNHQDSALSYNCSLVGGFFDTSKILAPLWSLMGTRANDPYRIFMSYKRIEPIHRNSIPDEFDSRTNWPHCPTIGEISEQGKCASCWAVAPTEVMSDRICIHSGGRRIVRLSAGNLLTCCRLCGKGCRGGFPGGAWYHWKRQGIVTGGSFFSKYGCQKYPIFPCKRNGPVSRMSCPASKETPKCVQSCQDSYPIPYQDDLYFAESIYRVPNDVEAIQLEIMTNGPVQAVIRIYDDLITHKSGVYQHSRGNGMEYHAVRIIGWGIENKVPYWLAANMWSQRWGEGGFFKILRGLNMVEVEAHIMAGIPFLSPEEKHSSRSTYVLK